MIPLIFLCDEYIDRPKLTEQKNPFEYIVPPPPLQWARNNYGRFSLSVFLKLKTHFFKCNILFSSHKLERIIKSNSNGTKNKATIILQIVPCNLIKIDKIERYTFF